jgi:hypothetical protein
LVGRNFPVLAAELPTDGAELVTDAAELPTDAAEVAADEVALDRCAPEAEPPPPQAASASTATLAASVPAKLPHRPRPLGPRIRPVCRTVLKGT